MSNRHKWTSSEENVVETGVENGRSAKEISKLLPNIPLQSIQSKIHRYKVKRPKTDSTGFQDNKPSRGKSYISIYISY